jgi:lambda family phage portal protein
MALNPLKLDLPSMSAVVAERQRAETAAKYERQLVESARELAQARRVARTYAAASVSRFTNSWPITQATWQAELYRSLRALRTRSRDMSQNNPHMKRFLGMVRRNVVGPAGIKLQVRAKRGDELDELLNKEVEDKFAEWSLPEHCSASGKYSWTLALALAIGTMARDGEFLCRLIDADNPFGFALKFYDVAYLDETYNEVLKSGNRVIMSVEVDSYDRPVAYYFTTPRYDVGPYATPPMQRVRIPAEQVIHCYLPLEDDAQVRGVPWAHAAMYELHILGQYKEAELINAHISACKMGFVVPPDNDETAGIPEEEEDGRPQISDRAEPGLMQELPPGYDFKTFNPEHPSANFDPFTSSVLRGAACGLDVSYFALAGDLTAVNYSSARVGLLDDRDNYRGLQNYLIDHFVRPVYRAWLKRAILTGAVNILPSDYERLKSPDFQPRGWPWVDPLKDIAAAGEAIDRGLATRSAFIAEQGGDFEDTIRRLSEEQDYMDKHKVVVKKGDLAPLAAIAAASDKERP